jgi:O-antigen/teichoic acid export membrane protein
MIKPFKILQNSIFLALQPLFMQVISLFVVGFIARKLGKADFGIFNFVTAFAMLFYPLAVLGLNRVTVRDLAGITDKGEYAQRMFTLRLVALLLCTTVIIGVVNTAGYPARTVTAVYWFSAVFLFQLLSEALTDVFNANQQMKYTALIGLTAGLTLTILSVIVLYLGFGLFELLGVYAFGQLLGMLVAAVIASREFFKIRLRFSLSFMKAKLAEGFQFFIMTMTWFAMMRIDTVFLSKRVSMEQLGLYTAAVLLVTKLSFIPHAISSALLPAFSQAYSAGETKEISALSGALISKIVLFALPCVLTISAFAEDVVVIIFGDKFIEAGWILKIGIWAFLFTCMAFCEFSLLTAIHKQKYLLLSYIISGLYCVVANLILINLYQTQGAVMAFTSTQLLLLCLFSYFTTKFITGFLQWKSLLLIVLINSGYFLFISGFRATLSLMCIPIGLILYIVIAYAVKLIELNDINNLRASLSGI